MTAEITAHDPKPSVLAELSDNGEHVRVTFKYNPKFVKALRNVPGNRFRGKDKPDGPCYRVHLDLPTMRVLREQLGDDLTLGPKLREWGAAAVAKERNLQDLSQADDAELENFSVVNPPVKGYELRPYQRADIKFMASTSTINANQPGAGKTLETIGAVIELGLEWGQHLVLAPKSSLRRVWEDEIKAVYTMAGLDEPVILTGDTPKERRAALAEAKELADGGYAFWLVLNPAMARMERRKVEGTSGDNIQYEEGLKHPELQEIDWDTMIADEFHLMGLSNPSTQTAAGVYHIAELTQPTRKWALSGTPMGGKPVKLWGALHFLEPEEFTSRWNWARHWLVINTNGYGSAIEGIMPGREVDFYDHLKSRLVRRTKKEALPGLPPKQIINVWCDMTKTQNEQYTQFALDAEWRLDDQAESGRLSATNVLAEYMRLKQFAGAYCDVAKTGKEVNGREELRVIPTQDSGKLETLLEKLAEENVIVAKGNDEEEPKCALVFSQFNGMVEMVSAALEAKGVPVATITGKTGGKRRADLVTAFQEQTEGAPRVLVINTMAGGTALNLSQADSVHMLDETWVPDNQEQAEDRAHRGDAKTMAKENVRIYYYRTKGSIEEYIQKLVADKQMNNRTILDLRRRMAKELAKAESEKEAGL